MNPTDEKISAFLKRYLQTPSREQSDAACERNLERLHATLQGKQQEPAVRLRPFEVRVLTAVCLLGREGCSRRIREKINETSDKQVKRGALIMVLERMEDDGLLESWLGDDVTERRFFAATPRGESALAHARELQELSGWVFLRSV
jgi:hypothetical protein